MKKTGRFPMDEQDVLQHLLDVEAQASVLVDDAQAEADKRIAGGEKKNRALYDERYSHEVAELDHRFEKEIAAIKAGYSRELEAYRNSLSSLAADQPAFDRLAESFLLRDR